jgi:hypothetical protein
MEAGLSEPLQHEPPTEERILTMDYAATQAWSLGPLLPPRNQWAIEEVDRLYRQLAEIHAISVAQLAKCTWWHHSDANPSPIWFRTDRWSPNGMPPTTRMAPLPPVDFSPKLRYGSKACVMSPWYSGRRARDPNSAGGNRATTSPADEGGMASTPRGRWSE